MAKAILRPTRETRVRSGHPWVFASDIERVEGDFTPGDIVNVQSSKGTFLGKAFYNPNSQIALRMLTYKEEEINAEFAELEKVLEERLAPLGIIGEGFKPATRFFHYVFCEPDSEDVEIMLEASKEATGKQPIVCGSCLSDLSVISKYGSSRAYGFGAGRDFSEVGGAHQPNEWIETERLLQFTKVIGAYVLKTLG